MIVPSFSNLLPTSVLSRLRKLLPVLRSVLCHQLNQVKVFTSLPDSFVGQVD